MVAYESEISSPAEKKNRRRGRDEASFLLFLFLFFLAAYLLSAAGYIDTTDGFVVYATTRSIVERGSLHLSDLDSRHLYVIEQQGPWPPYSREGKEGKFYGKYGLGGSFLQVPFYLVGKNLGRLRGGSPDESAEFAVSLENSFLTAASAVLLALFALKLGWSRKVAFASALLFGFATMAWPYSKMSFTEAAQGLFLLLSIYLAWDYERKAQRPLFLLMSGAAFGFLLLIKVSNLIFLPALLVLFIRKDRSLIAGRIVIWMTGLLPLAALFLLLNYIRFGSPLESGFGKEATEFSTALATGLYGLLISARRGFLYYCPLSIAAFIGIWLLAKKAPRLAGAILLGFVLNLILYSKWHYWTGGRCWGPRFLVPTIPLISLGLIPVVGVLKKAKKRYVLFLCLVIISTAIQAVSVLIPWHLPEGFRYVEGLSAEERESLPSQLASSFVVLDHLIFEGTPYYRLEEFGVRSGKIVHLSGRDFDRFNFWWLGRGRENFTARYLAPLIIAGFALLALVGCVKRIKEEGTPEGEQQ